MLNNMKVYICSRLIQDPISGLKTIAGSSTSTSTNMNYTYSYTTINALANGTGGNATIFVGSGDSPNSDTLYTLENEISTLSIVSGSKSTTSEKLVLTKTYKNNTSETVTIKEIGLFINVGSVSAVMLDRQVLDTPIVLEPNKVATVTMTLFA